VLTDAIFWGGLVDNDAADDEGGRGADANTVAMTTTIAKCDGGWEGGKDYILRDIGDDSCFFVVLFLGG